MINQDTLPEAIPSAFEIHVAELQSLAHSDDSAEVHLLPVQHLDSPSDDIDTKKAYDISKKSIERLIEETADLTEKEKLRQVDLIEALKFIDDTSPNDNETAENESEKHWNNLGSQATRDLVPRLNR